MASCRGLVGTGGTVRLAILLERVVVVGSCSALPRVRGRSAAAPSPVISLVARGAGLFKAAITDVELGDMTSMASDRSGWWAPPRHRHGIAGEDGCVLIRSISFPFRLVLA